MSILGNRIYYVDSEDRRSGSSSNFTAAIDIPEGFSFDSCCVLSMTIPRSYYLVRAGQNLMKVQIDGSTYSILFPVGNYNVTNFITTLLPLLNALSANVFTMTFNSITGKFSYAYTGAATVVRFILADPSRIGHQLGFDETSDNLFVGKALVSKNVVDFVSTSTLFLHSDMVEDSSSVLQEVYSDNSVPFSNLVYNCKFPAMYSKTLKNSTSGVFNFSLTDEHDLEVDLNGHELMFTLLLYRKENLSKLVKALLLKDE